MSTKKDELPSFSQPVVNGSRGAKSRVHRAAVVLVALLLAASMTWRMYASSSGSTSGLGPFYWSSHNATSICPGGHSRSGYIGLRGDSEESPRRSFYWLFDAQVDAETAPVVLTIGGGPGTSGLLNPLFGQSHCTITENGTTPNPNAWSEHNNLLALDHPIGVGNSYGLMVDNSRDAAHDVYDFFQKFFAVYPHLANNPVVLASGSYGGIYLPHIATVINEGNKAVARGTGLPGARHINLESIMVSNPWSDAMTHFRWLLQQRCYNYHVYNATTCADMYEILPQCLESIEFSYENPSTDNKLLATQTCFPLMAGATNGTLNENCFGTLEECNPEIIWATDLLTDAHTKSILGVPASVNWTGVNTDVNLIFVLAGDYIQRAYPMYEQLLLDGIRILHYVGKIDAIAAWPGVLSFLRLLRSPYQAAFRAAPDVPWPEEGVATKRVIGAGAGDFTYILMDKAGHFVTKDQPALVRQIVDHWIPNTPFE